jgi:hypothetical protein
MSFIFGSKQKGKQEQRIANVRERDTGTNEAARVVPVVWGYHKLAGTYISNIFNQIAEPIQETYKAGKKKKTVTTGYNYKGSFAQLLCMGEITFIQAIYSNDEKIWEGMVFLEDLDYGEGIISDPTNGKISIMTKIGQFHIYFGTPDQNPDPILNDGQAYRNFCYFVAENIQFGQNPSPGNFSLRIYRGPFDSDGFTPPTVSYVTRDLLLNPVYGLGLSEEILDGENSHQDEVYVSPILDRNTTFRQFMGELLPYANAALIYRNNRIVFLIERYEDGPGLVISTDELTDEPEIEHQSWSQTFAETRVTFTDIDKDFNDNVATFSDPANAQIQGVSIQKQFSRPYIYRQSDAFLQAYSIGKMGGTPKLAIRFRTRTIYGGGDFIWEDLYPTKKISITYPPLGLVEKPFRIRSITIAKPLEPGFEIEAEEDLTYLLENEYEPVPDELPPPEDHSPADAFMRIGALPPDLRDGGDGILVCPQRPHSLIIGGSVYAGWDGSLFVFLNEFTTYPLRLMVNRWRRFAGGSSPTNWLLDVTVETDFENNILIAFRDEAPELFLVFGIRKQGLYSSLDEHQVTPAWTKLKFNGRFVAVASRRWEIEVEPSAFGSDGLVLENFITPSEGFFPTEIAFIGREGDFWTMPSTTLKFLESGGNDDSDTDEKRYIQILTSTFDGEQDLGDGATLYFDRNDTGMALDGTFEQDWGAKVSNKEHVSEVMVDLPVLYFRLAETSGSTASDYTGHGHDAVISGSGVTMGEDSPLLLDPWDKAFGFNNGLITVPDDTDLRFEEATTVAFWIKTSQSAEAFLISKHEEEVSGYEVSMDASGKIRLHIHHGTGTAPQYTLLTSTDSVNDGQWHHVAVRFGSGVLTLLIDGVLDSNTETAPVSSIPANTIDLVIGKRDSGLLPFVGNLDEIAFFNAVLSDERILAHYTSGKGDSW